jgi:hypothetical protein
MATKIVIGLWYKFTVTLLVLAVISGCGSNKGDSAEKGTIPAESITQIEEFIQSKISTDWDKTAIAGKGTPVQILLRVGPATDPTVCSTGEIYGPLTITDNSVVGSQSVNVSQPTLRLANQGGLSICLIITSPVNANLDVDADALYIDANECNETPASISGVWEGDYSCTSSCGNESGTVSLTIQQNEYSATYIDDGAGSYEGTVCGNVFEFSGGGPGYTESGTFTLNSNGSASKTSSYQDTGSSCSGTCSDPVLTHN